MANEKCIPYASATEIERGLRVCRRCGWYVDQFIQRECLVKEGQLADAITQSVRNRFVPPIAITKLGYGRGRLVFEFNESLNLKVVPLHNGKFRIEDIFALGDFTQDELLLVIDCLRRLPNNHE